MKIKKWLDNNTFDLTGKTIAITGSTGEIASFLVENLAKLNANFIFINRDKDKTYKQINNLKSINPKINIDFVWCDLSNFDSVKDAAEILKKKKFNILYLAAGAYNIKRFKTDAGFDNVFQINFLSQYYLAKELATNIKNLNGKIIAVSSIAHSYSKIDANDIDFSTRKKHSKVYGNAKRFLTFALQEMAEATQINLAIAHPGVTLTEMTNHYPKAINWLVKWCIKCFFPKKEMSALSLIKAIFETTSHHQWIGPKIFNVWGQPQKSNLKTCSIEESKNIYNIAETIYNQLKK